MDDRIRYFLQSKPRQGYDELLFRRTEVVFRLPARLKLARSPSEPNARVRGILKVDDGRLVCDVNSLELLPNDGDRLERELGRLRADDIEGKRGWALWAERRGKELNEPKLEARGIAIEAEVFWAEADRPNADPVALAVRAADRPIPAALRHALLHRRFRSVLAKLSDPAELDALANKVEAELPDSTRPASGSIDSNLLDAYRLDPAVAYREASEVARAGLDRRLRGDVIQKSLERQLELRPSEAAALADIAREKLPDRPTVAESLRRSGLKELENRVTGLRQSEVEELARTFREQGEVDRAGRLIRAWLDDRRKNRLSGTDAEGRVLLAANYDRMLGDKATAADLLREALAIDPQSRPAADAFLRMGFRKGDAGWYDPDPDRGSSTSAGGSGRPSEASRSAPTESSDPLKGLTRAQVRSRLGSRPDQILRNATQGRCLEQWIFRSGKSVQVINFLIEPGTIEPRVLSHYVDQD